MFGELPPLILSMEAAGSIAIAIGSAGTYIGTKVVVEFFKYLATVDAGCIAALDKREAERKADLEREVKERAATIVELSDSLRRMDEERMSNTKLLMDLQRTTTDVLAKMEMTLNLIRERMSNGKE